MSAHLLVLPRLHACQEATQPRPTAGPALVVVRGSGANPSQDPAQDPGTVSAAKLAVSNSGPALRLVTPSPGPANSAQDGFLPGARKGPQRITLLHAAAAPAVASPRETPSVAHTVVDAAVHAAVHAAEAALNAIHLRRQRATLDGVGLEFYRKYTEAMLRRYVRLSMEAGRVPSMLGRELFRGHVSTHKVQSFEDVSNFVHDISRCLALLDPGQQHLVRRIALEEYTQEETAAMLGMSLRTVIRRYREAIDRLTRTLLERRMLEPLKATDLNNL